MGTLRATQREAKSPLANLTIRTACTNVPGFRKKRLEEEKRIPPSLRKSEIPTGSKHCTVVSTEQTLPGGQTLRNVENRTKDANHG